MKKIFILSVIAVLCIQCNYAQSNTADTKVDINAQGANLSFEKIEHDFGKIQQNGNGTYSFVFTNNGNEPLILTNVRSSCGCTVPKWPREPIQAGKSAKIDVKYDTRRIGIFSKSISVYSNASDKATVLRIKGEVQTLPSSN